MGSVVALCIEKSCRAAFAPGAARPPGARSTANDSARTSGLKSGFTFGSELENLHRGGVHTGPGVDAPGESRRQRGIAARGDVEDLEFRSHAHAFRVGRAAERPVRPGRACLEREKPLDDLRDVGLFGGELAFGRLSGPDRHEWVLLGSRHFRLAMNFVAVMLGKKQ